MTKAATALAAAALAGCASLTPREPEPLPPESATAAPVGLRVEGVVTDRWGYVVPNASITVRVGSPHTDLGGDPDCDDASHLPTRTRGAPTGVFAVVVQAGRREPFLACVEIEALPPRGLGLRENVTVVPSAAFTAAGAAGGGEAVRVRVVLH